LNKITIFLSSLMICQLGLNGSDNILSQTKQNYLDQSYLKAIEDSDKLKNDWINPIVYKYIYNKGEKYTTKRSYIGISQPIFKSGGIYYAIKYANSMEKYSKSTVDNQKKELIKQIVNLLFQIKYIDFSIKKQQLLIENSNLEINRKKEQVLNGILDTSFLDNAILDANMKKNSLIDLEYKRVTYINNLSLLSDKNYDQFELPSLELVNYDNYLAKNIYLSNYQEEIKSSYWVKNMVLSNYLPTVNLTADYTKYHDTDNNPMLSEDATKNIGFNITIPLDIKYSNTIESSKIEYLKKKTQLEDKQKEEINIYNLSIANIKALDQKIKIAKSDLKLYDSLLTQMIEQQEVGMKTDSDVQTMINSKKIKQLDIKGLEVQKQISYLDIYARIEDGQ